MRARRSGRPFADVNRPKRDTDVSTCRVPRSRPRSRGATSRHERPSGTSTSTSRSSSSCRHSTSIRPRRDSSAVRAHVRPPPGRGAIRTAVVARFEWRDTSDRPVDPVGDRAERVVVEARHLPRVDRAVRQHRVPALPDGRRTHRHRVEPRWTLALQQQLVGVVEVTGRRECIRDERCAREAGRDAVVALAHELCEAVSGSRASSCRRADRTRWRGCTRSGNRTSTTPSLST